MSYLAWLKGTSEKERPRNGFFINDYTVHSESL